MGNLAASNRNSGRQHHPGSRRHSRNLPGSPSDSHASSPDISQDEQPRLVGTRRPTPRRSSSQRFSRRDGDSSRSSHPQHTRHHMFAAPVTVVTRHGHTSDRTQHQRTVSQRQGHERQDTLEQIITLQTIQMLHQQYQRRLAELEEQQMQLALRLGMLSQLPTSCWDESRQDTECVICLDDYTIGENLRILPCMHYFHVQCIDEWLMKSFTCPSCMESVDTALISAYRTD